VEEAAGFLLEVVEVWREPGGFLLKVVEARKEPGGFWKEPGSFCRLSSRSGRSWEASTEPRRGLAGAGRFLLECHRSPGGSGGFVPRVVEVQEDPARLC
jgi:hypothetical protein